MYKVSHDYYSILGVSKNATPREIKKQYKKLIREHHPDKFKGLRAKYRDKGDEDLLEVIDERTREAEGRCQLINEAFGVLSNPTKRKQYDKRVVEPSVPLPKISIHPTRLAFGSLLKGRKKSLVFTIENKGGPPARINIDWEGGKPDWGELAIEPDAEKVFPIKVTVRVATSGIPSGPKDKKILVNVDGRIHMVEVFLAVTSRVVAPATRARPPASPTKTSLTGFAILGAILIFAIIGIGVDQRSKEGQQAWATMAARAQEQSLEATAQAKVTAQTEALGQSPTIAASSVQNGHIAFCSDRSGNFEIYVMNTDELGQTNLTNNPADDYDPAWSPDGKKIAFSRYHGGGNDEIYVMNADGSGQTRLTNNSETDDSPAWSPDGKKIAFYSCYSWRGANTKICVMNADGSGQTSLTNNSAVDYNPTWSPDGKKIAFSSSHGGGNHEIYVMNTDGSGQTNLTNNSADDYSPAWSPDGKKITFSSYRGSNFEIYVMNTDGSGQTNLTNNPADDYDPAWSPDGKKIAFYSYRGGNDEIYVMNADGSGQTNLTNNSADDYNPAWEPRP